MLRRVAVVVVALLAFVGGPMGLLRALAGQDLTAMTNADRVSRGLRALSTAGDLQSLAQQRADEMARSGRLAHTTNLGSKVSGWQRLGENVGRGPKLPDIETAFMNSPSHRENILDPAFTQVGVGMTFDGKDYLYVAVIFRQPGGAVSAAPPAPSPPTTRAAAAPKPKPPTPAAALPPPTTTTTHPPTTTTTTTAPPPPPPPVEEVAAAPVEAPPPVETTTTTAPRPVFANPDFLAANFSDRLVPAAARAPIPVHAPVPLVVTAVLGVVMGAAGTATAYRRLPRRPKA
ncbi:MAG: hypothetical protein QOE80_377 [Actinomycetota bacterium]|nr:hypothetical protein [Actinomycetota bacterium]